jgi:hypothetical protein
MREMLSAETCRKVSGVAEAALLVSLEESPVALSLTFVLREVSGVAEPAALVGLSVSPVTLALLESERAVSGARMSVLPAILVLSAVALSA